MFIELYHTPYSCTIDIAMSRLPVVISEYQTNKTNKNKKTVGKSLSLKEGWRYKIGTYQKRPGIPRKVFGPGQCCFKVILHKITNNCFSFFIINNPVIVCPMGQVLHTATVSGQ